MWVETGFPPETFWHQTARSFSNALAGAARHRIKMSWQIAVLAGAASVGKLRPLDEYLPVDHPVGTPGAMKMLGYLQRLKSCGAPITIERIDRRKLN